MFLDAMIPWSTFTSHNQPPPEIWFETEHFEILSFLGPGLKFPSITSWAWNGSREQLSRIFENFKIYLESIQIDEQNLEIISKSEKIDFSTKFARTLIFAKIKANLNWHNAFKLR